MLVGGYLGSLFLSASISLELLSDPPQFGCDWTPNLASISIKNSFIYAMAGFKFAHLRMENSVSHSWMDLAPAWSNCTTTSATFLNNTHHNSSIHSKANGLVFRRNRFVSQFSQLPGVPFPAISVDLRSDLLSTVDARGNWWGSPSGPHTCCNPEGEGVDVLLLTDFRSWCLVRGIAFAPFTLGLQCFAVFLQDEACSTFASDRFDAPLRLKIDSCQLDPICGAGSTNSLIAYGALEALVVLLLLAAVLVTIFDRRLSSADKTRRSLHFVVLAHMACDIIGIVCSIAFVANIPRDSLLWFVSRYIVLTSIITLALVLVFQFVYGCKFLVALRRPKFGGLLGVRSLLSLPSSPNLV